MLIFYASDDDTIDTEKIDGICSLTLVVDQFSGLFNLFYYTFKIYVNEKSCFIRFLILIKL